MPDTEQISQPSLGSNELGTETNDARIPSSGSAGSDTQTRLAAISGKHHATQEEKEEAVKNNLKGTDFADSMNTDE